MEAYERILLVKPEVFVFRIPPLTAGRGHKAADWKLDTPDWVGRLRLVSIEEKLEIRLEDKSSGNLYAKAPVAEANGVDFESVSDSSRYFVIRLRNDKGQTAFVGIGFADRGDSFDLNVAIQDHFKSLKKSEEVDKMDNTPRLDLSFKEGQTIKKKTESSINQSPRPVASSSTGPVPLLPPPPSSGSVVGGRSRPRGQ